MSFAPMAIGPEPLRLDTLVAWVERSSRGDGEGCGAVTSFLGVVRRSHRGRPVRYLEYEAHVALAEKTFHAIARESVQAWPGTLVTIHHRVGRLEIGEASVAIAAASAHRREAFQVCRYAIERVKQIAPIWKREYFEDGDAWVEGPVADPADEALRQSALAVACA